LICVLQRVSQASVTVAATGYAASIGPGLLVLLGVEQGDGEADAEWMARKLANLRIFADEQGLMNRSVLDIGGAVLVVSQFTLAGDCRKGNRPSFIGAADPALGRQLYERVCRLLREQHGLGLKTGEFGAMMQVSLVNEGPVTIILKSDKATKRPSD
jgi:D-tyrosyl-tRNA(Tyr) deacylase